VLTTTAHEQPQQGGSQRLLGSVQLPHVLWCRGGTGRLEVAARTGARPRELGKDSNSLNFTSKLTRAQYRRPSYAPYEAQDVVGDVALGYLAYPRTLKFGGNLGKVNTFTGVNVANLTGGVLSAENLFTGDNFACFAFQLLEQGIPDFASKILNALDPVTSLVNKYVGPVLGGLSCPQLGHFDNVSSAALSLPLSSDARSFANIFDRFRASLIPSLAVATTRLVRLQTTSKQSKDCCGESATLQPFAQLCHAWNLESCALMAFAQHLEMEVVLEGSIGCNGCIEP
jgi:hypothetical protein